MNAYGWSSFSDITYVLAATIPEAPPKPEFVSATTVTISLSFSLSTDNKGSAITGYKLYMNTGTDGSAFSEVTSYTSSSFALTHTVDATDGIVDGKIYQFYWVAVNTYGDSDASEILKVAAADEPAQPSAPDINYDYSTKTSAYIEWTAVADGTSPGGLITGYDLYMDDGMGGDFDLIYSTVNFSPAIT